MHAKRTGRADGEAFFRVLVDDCTGDASSTMGWEEKTKPKNMDSNPLVMAFAQFRRFEPACESMKWSSKTYFVYKLMTRESFCRRLRRTSPDFNMD
jgi:hypothetical protein